MTSFSKSWKKIPTFRNVLTWSSIHVVLHVAHGGLYVWSLALTRLLVATVIHSNTATINCPTYLQQNILSGTVYFTPGASEVATVWCTTVLLQGENSRTPHRSQNFSYERNVSTRPQSILSEAPKTARIGDLQRKTLPPHPKEWLRSYYISSKQFCIWQDSLLEW